MSAGGRPLRRLAVLVVTPIVLLVALEAGSYLVGRFDGPLQPLRVGNIQLYGRHDPQLFWSLDPGATAPDGTPWINSLGLRGPEFDPAEDSGTTRILSLGESTTFAAQMDYGRCYSAVLERLLNRSEGVGPVRVLNGGVPGYSLFQGVHYLLERSDVLGPDVVLFYFGFNDFLPVAYLEERAGESRGRNDRELYALRQEPLQRLRAWLLARSNLARGLLVRQDSSASGGASQGKSGVPPTPTLDDRPRVPAADRLHLLALARDHARERGIELVIVVPFYREFDEHADLLRTFAREHDVTLVDLPALLPARLDRPRAEYFFDPVHPTPAGHRLIAEALAEVLAPRLAR